MWINLAIKLAWKWPVCKIKSTVRNLWLFSSQNYGQLDREEENFEKIPHIYIPSWCKIKLNEVECNKLHSFELCLKNKSLSCRQLKIYFTTMVCCTEKWTILIRRYKHTCKSDVKYRRKNLWSDIIIIIINQLRDQWKIYWNQHSMAIENFNVIIRS